MKKRLLNISLITLLALSLIILGPITAFAAISPNSPAGGVYIVPDQKIYNSAAYCTYNDTTFTVEVLMEDFTGVAGYQFKITYNSTLLALDSWTFDTDVANPMSPTQMAPDSGDRVDTDVSSAGTVQLATVWKSGVSTYTYAGNATAAELVFRIIYCPEQLLGDPAPDNTVSTALTFDTGNTR